ncbi:MAG: hypothetical protein ABW186_02220 [Rhodanobacteraceae bacterium]
MPALREIVACAALGCAAAAPAHGVERSASAPVSVAQLCRDVISSAGFEAVTRHCSASGTTLIYTDRAAFLEAIEVGHIDNDFDDIPPGPSGELHFDEDGFQYRIVTQFGAHGLLFNGDGFPSTERAVDSLQLFVVPFVRPVNAIGADFFTTNLSVTPAAGTVHLFVGEDVEETLESTGAPVFRGFISDLDLSGWDEFATGEADGAPIDRWPAMDNLLLGLHR